VESRYERQKPFSPYIRRVGKTYGTFKRNLTGTTRSATNHMAKTGRVRQTTQKAHVPVCRTRIEYDHRMATSFFYSPSTVAADRISTGTYGNTLVAVTRYTRGAVETPTRRSDTKRVTTFRLILRTAHKTTNGKKKSFATPSCSP